MSINRGKKFEEQIKSDFEKLDNVSIDRVHDQTNGYLGSSNISDFIVYRKPYQYYIECKSVHGNTLSIHGNDPKHKYGIITNKQWEGMLEKSNIEGVRAGVICWWVDKDITRFLPIQYLQALYEQGQKSVRFDFEKLFNRTIFPEVIGKKKRVFFTYDMESFFSSFERW